MDGQGRGRFYFNPRSPCGERREEIVYRPSVSKFQSTLPVWGATKNDNARRSLVIFQSTLPVWGATDLLLGTIRRGKSISIHAPRVGSDLLRAAIARAVTHFNPRSPCGERPPIFQTPDPRTLYFNPRSPCGERQSSGYDLEVKTRNFNPRSPCGERRQIIEI